MSIQLEVVYHYREDDPACLSDYIGIEILRDGTLIRSYRDAYHDKGGLGRFCCWHGVHTWDESESEENGCLWAG